MHIILGIQMKADGNYSKQIQYNKITSLLIAVHIWRIGGIFFIWGMTQGLLDPAFAIPAGVGDILIGKGYSWSKYSIVVWSVLGIADLVNAVTLGVITNPDFRTSTMATLPWILVPTVAVPTALALHGIVLYRLRNWIPIQAHRKLQEP